MFNLDSQKTQEAKNVLICTNLVYYFLILQDWHCKSSFSFYVENSPLPLFAYSKMLYLYYLPSTASCQIWPKCTMEVSGWSREHTKYCNAIASGSRGSFSFLTHHSSNIGILQNFHVKKKLYIC